MTATLTGNRSPARPAAAKTRPQRARARHTLPRAGGGETLVTLSDHLERARRRADKYRATVTVLQATGAQKEAFNQAIDTFRAAMARELGRRPEEASALYEYFTDLMLTWAAQAPILVAGELAPVGSGGAR